MQILKSPLYLLTMIHQLQFLCSTILLAANFTAFAQTVDSVLYCDDKPVGQAELEILNRTDSVLTVRLKETLDTEKGTWGELYINKEMHLGKGEASWGRHDADVELIGRNGNEVRLRILDTKAQEFTLFLIDRVLKVETKEEGTLKWYGIRICRDTIPQRNGTEEYAVGCMCGTEKGPWRHYDAEGNIVRELFYDEEGRLHGNYKEYFYSGQIARQGGYEHGRFIGEWKSFYPNGTLSRRELFDTLHTSGFQGDPTQIDVQLPELDEVFDTNGVLVTRTMTSGNGFREHIDWYGDGSEKRMLRTYVSGAQLYRAREENGALKRIIAVDPGGWADSIFSGGNLMRVERFATNSTVVQGWFATETNFPELRDNIRIVGDSSGCWEWFFAGNVLQKHICYVANVRSGSYGMNYADGSPKIRCAYESGVLSGECLKWSPKGILTERSHYYAGELNGSYESFDETSGNPLVTATFSYGKLTGPYRENRTDGSPKAIGSYGTGPDAGRRTGKWTEWDASGKKTKTKYP